MNMFEAIKLNLKRKSRVLFGVYVCMLVCFGARQRKIIKPKKYFMKALHCLNVDRFGGMVAIEIKVTICAWTGRTATIGW